MSLVLLLMLLLLLALGKPLGLLLVRGWPLVLLELGWLQLLLRLVLSRLAVLPLVLVTCLVLGMCLGRQVLGWPAATVATAAAALIVPVLRVCYR